MSVGGLGAPARLLVVGARIAPRDTPYHAGWWVQAQRRHHREGIYGCLLAQPTSAAVRASAL